MTASRFPEDPVEVLSFFDDWVGTNNSGQWEAFAALLHDEVEMVDPLVPTPVVGRDAVVERAKAQFDPFPDGHIDVLGAPMRSLDGAALGYRWRFTGTFLRPITPPGFRPTGARITLDGASVLTVEGRLARRVEVFYDAAGVARQVGAAPPPGSLLEGATVLAQRLVTRWRRRDLESSPTA